jgi:CzcA family heavy metal efflux pump
VLRALVAFALRRRGSLLGLAAALVVYGIFVAQRAPLDVLPDFAPPKVEVQCEAPGFTAEQVERLVTTPIEAALAGAGDLEVIRSTSSQGLAVIDAIFRDGVDIFRERQLLAEQLAQVQSSLPEGVGPPKLSPLTSATMDLLKFGLVARAGAQRQGSPASDPRELRAFAEWTLAPKLRAVPGVASVTLFGGEVRQWNVEVDPVRLAAAGVALDELAAAVRAATGVRGGGFVENASQRIVVETRGEALTAEELGAAVIRVQAGVPLRVADVATVVDGVAPKFGDCLIGGEPGVLVKILSQYGANTWDVTKRVEAALEELKPAIEALGADYHPRLHRPADFIEISLENLGHSLLIGAAMVAVVLFLFLLDVRVAFISMTAIPLSLLAAVIALERLGFTLNTMTLGGLAIALGEVVDDAIIDVENIVRRLRENAALAAPRRLLDVVFDASLEVRGSVVYAAVVVVIVFVPVLMLSGLQGRMFAPLGLAYVFAVVASLAVALTVTPALALVLLGRRHGVEKPAPLFIRALGRGYEALLRPVLARPWIAVALALLLAAAAAAVVPALGGEFLPEFREGHFVLQLSLAPGVSLDEMKRVGALVSRELLANPHVDTVEQQIGRAELSEDPWGPNKSEFHINLKPLPPEVEAGVRDEIDAVLKRLPGAQTELLTFLGDRIGETISGETAQIVVSLYGDDLDALDAIGDRVQQELAAVPGAVDVARGALGGTPSLAVELRRDRLARHGLSALAVLEAVELAFKGREVAQVHEGARVIDVALQLPEPWRRQPESVARLLLRAPSGELVPLEEVAHVDMTTSRPILSHEGGRRRQTVTCNVRGRDVTSFSDEARRRITAAVQLPAGSYFEFGGAAEQQRAAGRELLLHSGLAAVAIVLVLGGAFGSVRNLLLVLANLPFAFVGGVLAAWATGGTISMGSLVGFVTLFGVTMRNSIMLVSHLEHLVAAEGIPFGRDAVLRGARERLLPILMTAVVTTLALLPIALGRGSAGREIEGPMAVVILGGLATSTLLNLLLLPSLALRFGRFGRARAE